ncbi:DNA primase [Metamycoplasma neophronis]|uniref:DNA primase n=1 Tax=Metamycoplasma neophronis TaxID=872983 RepID=A0ABY2YZX8_9BACT|nr:DNA primase [Metamycoplasma neophronis]TPR54042.1 DNA primase [Metamycoplasma neophronis]
MAEKVNVWELVLSKTDIISVIGEYVTLTKQGKNYKACCPFHGEKTPSFVVNPEKNIFKCFGCGKSGNALKFLEYFKNISNIEALKLLAKKANVNIENYLTNIKETSFTKEQTKIFEINHDASDFFQFEMLVNKRADLKIFLEKRKLNKELIKEFKLGFADANKSIYNYLKEKKYDSFTIANSSLISSNEQKNFFNDRLIFPIEDADGNIVAFSGRDITSKNEPKYLNSSETSVFHKNEVMFNYYHAKDEIIKTGEVYLVEGQFDVIALYKAGIKNAIAIMGTSLSQEHLKLLKNCKINLFFDSDKAGILATKKNLKIILYFAEKYNLSVSIIFNSNNKDPDELYNLDNGKTLLKTCENKVDLSAYILAQLSTIHYNESLMQNEKFEQYKEWFEYMYYLNDQLKLTLKDILINKLNVFSEESYLSYSNDFLKPNFPSDINFAKAILYQNKKSQNTFSKANDINQFYDNFDDKIFDNFAPVNEVYLDRMNDENHTLNTEKTFYKINKKEPMLIPVGREFILIRILKSILKEPLFIKEFKVNEFDFINMNIDDRYKELITYVVKKIKNNQLVDFQNINELIYNDYELKIKNIEMYNSLLETSEKVINFNNYKNNNNLLQPYERKDFERYFSNLKTEKNDTTKSIITINKK